MESINSAFHAIEDIVLRHSGRGMTILQKHLGAGYCRRAAEHLLSLEKGNVLLTTGFYVGGRAETDGPPGTLCLALTLSRLGYSPIIVTDSVCRGLFDSEHIAVVYTEVNASADLYRELLDRYHPVCLISVERCGRNLDNDYANMRGVSIARDTAPIDVMFELAQSRHIPTIGIGDGGNEIGMGNVKDIIAEQIKLNPCTVPVDDLIVATTSNWGAYALSACLSMLSRRPVMPSSAEIARYLEHIVALGCVDGISKQPELSVDGFPPTVGTAIMDDLAASAQTVVAAG